MDKTIELYELVELLKPIYKKKDCVIKDEDFPEVTVKHAMEELSDVLMRVTARVIEIQESQHDDWSHMIVEQIKENLEG